MRVRKKAVIAAIAMMCSGSSFAAQEVVTLKFAHFVPPVHELSKSSFPDWVKAVEAASEGTVKIRMFPSGQLGKPADHYDLARDGIADITWANPGFNAGRFPIFSGSQLPMLVADSRSGSRALTEWYGLYAGQEMSDVKFCFGHMMYGDMLHTKQKVMMPDDLKGMKIRPSSSMEATLIREAGGAAVPGANPQAREMLDRGVVDGTMSTPSSLIAFGADKAVKHHLALQLSQPAWVIVINKNKYESLTPKQRKALDDNCTAEAAYKFAEPLYAFEAPGLAVLAERSAVTTPTPEAVAAWRQVAERVKNAWLKEIAAHGLDGSAIYDRLVDALDRHDARMK